MNINDTLQYLNIGLPDDIARRKAWGDFEGAIRLIDLRLAQDNLSEAMRACLTAEREIICRIPQNYPFDRAAALAVVRGHIPDFTEEEFDERVDAGKIRRRDAVGDQPLYLILHQGDQGGHHQSRTRQIDSR